MVGRCRWCGHAVRSLFERPPTLEPSLPRNQLLRIAELETTGQVLSVVEMPQPRQRFPNLGGDRVVPIGMPAKILLGLLLEVVEVRHGRNVDLRDVGGHCPFGLSRCALDRCRCRQSELRDASPR